MVISRGAVNFRFSMLWDLPPAAGMQGGGFGNALLGTLLLVGIGALVSVPLGVLTAVFLTEYSRGSKSARIIRFSAKILSGLPSILAGVFIFGVLVLTTKTFSVIAGGLALGILMLPIVILSTEEALLRVPRFLREASLALGANQTQTVLNITLPTAGPSHSNRRHAGHRSGGRGNGAYYLYRTDYSLLDKKLERTDGKHVCADL